jgi:cysteinyl-tRNA synthetase
MDLRLYNTESREKEAIKGGSDGKVRMYTCGPTIYNFAHIGNFRTYVFEDVLRRTIQFFGFPIEQVMNLTDIDDKTIRGAIQKGVSLKEFTEPFREAFFADLKNLSIEPAEHYPEATNYISEMIRMIEKLIEKGFAYKGLKGSIYFSIRHFPSYGRLSHFSLDDLVVNASGDNVADEYEKENISDFVLWKAYDPERDGDIFWESPFGKGRPGWHIECSAMATKLLGHTVDIHCGGIDNMFPHHENEIAQSEGCFGCCFVRHWVHVAHLLVDGRKMSKSLGNFYTLRDLLDKGYTGAEVRYLLLSTHYRTPLNFTLQGLDAARASLKRIADCIVRLQSIQAPLQGSLASPILKEAAICFQTELADDINISASLGSLFDFIRELNSLADQNHLAVNEAEEALQLFGKWNQVLAVLSLEKPDQIPSDLQHLLETREKARREKNYSLSDQIRKQIYAKGYLIEDTATGVRLKKI